MFSWDYFCCEEDLFCIDLGNVILRSIHPRERLNTVPITFNDEETLSQGPEKY